MNNLPEIIKQNFSGSLKNGVNARELHAFLESRQDFSTWIKNRIVDYGFIVNQDFISLHKIVERETGATRRIEYFLSLDMAKELSMVERNAKGKQARQYFIECEKQLSGSLKPTLPQNYKEALLDLVAQVEANEKLQQQITANAPKVAFADTVGNSDDVILIRDLAKLLKQNGVEIGERRLFVWLRENGYLTLDNKATQRSMNLGVFRMTESMIATPQGNQLRLTTKVTGKGQQYFLNRFKTEKAA
ncbi:antA/AntB antirepressor family protein [Kingella negevensis]|uniref:AntA/AntB antirepressor n=1 Tax=Kingella negevensis TaxID=1522312 RepID=A0A238HI51_9NEIS|nr:phage antirepressor KilAC domain-containing protein [Kingella negevensis]MDK4680152.1 antA/AntB antirepressor family protein [Kingella negevensis]MDK4682128.1 antA/AntB antirepressor family protein [Kingella negevensis]MDK4685571.1 antA/AntB antirepressor family protein [Kingella negevensis]MDK4690324.1 antA/AntB antirepressor family protein [Kingella negevensis]MDK4692329.1 antA/AntB antirepressor family protein [Kingella negevensis]